MKVKRGTTNANRRGNTRDRRSRRKWLIETFRADVDIFVSARGITFGVPAGSGVPACRCYRCGKLLSETSVTVDRVVPGCDGGTYARGNIRPSCAWCASVTGAHLGNARRRTR